VVNLDLPVGGGQRGAVPGGAIDEVTYVHRLGRATRSETASGLCINIAGGSDEENENAVTQLRGLSKSAHPAIQSFGPHFEVQRDIFRDGKPGEPLNFEVKVGDQWVEVPVTVNREGEDISGWTINFTFGGQTYNNVSIWDNGSVHAPFDYFSLDTEMELFKKKVTVHVICSLDQLILK
jgi:hypothetical protein